MSDLLTVSEVAERLRRSAKTIRRWIKDGKIQAVEIPGRGKSRTEYLIRESELERIIGTGEKGE